MSLKSIGVLILFGFIGALVYMSTRSIVKAIWRFFR